MLAPGQRDRAHRLGLVHLAVAHEGPDLAARRVTDIAPRQVLHEARLVDGRQRAEAHRDCRELPEAGHQPGVRVGRQPATAYFLAEAQHLLLREAAFEKGARVDAGRRVALDEDQVAAVVGARGVPEVVEADLVERRRRLEAGDVAAQLGGLLVGPQHRRDGVPAHQRADRVLKVRVAGDRRFEFLGDRVDVRRAEVFSGMQPASARVSEERFEQLAGATRPVAAHDRVERVEPLGGLRWVDVR